MASDEPQAASPSRSAVAAKSAGTPSLRHAPASTRSTAASGPSARSRLSSRPGRGEPGPAAERPGPLQVPGRGRARAVRRPRGHLHEIRVSLGSERGSVVLEPDVADVGGLARLDRRLAERDPPLLDHRAGLGDQAVFASRRDVRDLEPAVAVGAHLREWSG